MSSQSHYTYRGCQIEVHVSSARAHAFGGICRRYRVAWTVSASGNPDQKLARFPAEQFDFLSEQEALSYGEKRAYTFIDGALSTPSQGRIGVDNAKEAAR